MATQNTPTARGVRLRLLGEPALETDAPHAPSLTLERKTAGLLALLALDGPMPRARAAALLWPTLADAAARNNLRQRLHRLHRRAGRPVAEAAGDMLRLAHGVTHDIGNTADDLARDPAAASGDLLGTHDFTDCDGFDAWLQMARERWRVARRGTLALIASELEKQGHLALALLYGQRLIDDDPLLEHAHRRLMRLHYLGGDRAAALAVFARCRDVLRRALGVSPSHETVELARLIEASGVLPDPATPPATTVLRPPRLVGRDTDWRRLEIAGQQGRFALIIGEPGIGKSRLLAEFAACHDTLVRVGARPGDAGVPFVLLARLLRAMLERFAHALEPWARIELAHLLPELGRASTAWPATVRLGEAARAAIGAVTPAMAGCIVDDLHFADEPSLELILGLASPGIGPPLRWIASVRVGEMPAALLGWLDRADPLHVERLQIGPLDAAAVQALLASLALPGFDALAWAEALARHTHGNPLFILETLSLLLSRDQLTPSSTCLQLPAPASAEQVIEKRLGQLSPEALRLARLAALAGPVFGPELAARVLRLHPLDLASAWRELEAAQVIGANGFVHDLVFEVTLRSVPQPIARLLRHDIATALGQEPDEPAQRVAKPRSRGAPARAMPR